MYKRQSHKIDVVVALAQAALAAVHKGNVGHMRTGAINTHGVVDWREPKPHSRILWATVTEQEMLAQKAGGTW